VTGEPLILWEVVGGTASRAPEVTLAAGFGALYPPCTGFRGHDGTWPSEGEHAVRPYTCVLPDGACRGPKALCILFPFPQEWGLGGVKEVSWSWS